MFISLSASCAFSSLSAMTTLPAWHKPTSHHPSHLPDSGGGRRAPPIITGPSLNFLYLYPEYPCLISCDKPISKPIMVAQGKFTANCLKQYKVAPGTEGSIQPQTLSWEFLTVLIYHNRQIYCQHSDLYDTRRLLSFILSKQNLARKARLVSGGFRVRSLGSGFL